MDDNAIELFKDLRSDIKDINKKVDSLLEFKWKLVGGSIVASFFFSLLTAIVFNLMKAKS